MIGEEKQFRLIKSISFQSHQKTVLEDRYFPLQMALDCSSNAVWRGNWFSLRFPQSHGAVIQLDTHASCEWLAFRDIFRVRDSAKGKEVERKGSRWSRERA